MTKGALRDRIIAAAATLFARSGFNGVTTLNIAQAAHIADGSMFRYFPTKRALFVASIDSELGKLSARAEPLLQITNAEDSQVALRTLFDLIADTLMRERNLARLLQFSLLEYGPDLEPVFRRHLRPVVELVARNMKNWSSSSDIRDLDPSLVVLPFIASITGVILLHDVFPDFYGSSAPFDSVERCVAAATELWFRLLSPESVADRSARVIAQPRQ